MKGEKWLLYTRGRPPPSSQFHVVRWIFFSLLLTINSASLQKFNISFTKLRYNASVPENALGNTYVISDEKMGIFLPPENRDLNIKYRIIGGDVDNFFKASSRVIGNFCFLEIVVRTGKTMVLNKEKKNSYLLNIKALNKKRGRSKIDLPRVVTTVHVRITDLNDIDPIFSNNDNEYSFQVSEDTPLYASVGKVMAEDPDEGLNGEVYYSFESNTSVFAIHPTSGVITLTKLLSQPDYPKYALKVVARDRGLQLPGSYPSTANVYFTVTVVNVFEPTIQVTKLSNPIVDGHLLVMAIININDKDHGPGGEVGRVEIIEGDKDKLFRISRTPYKNEYNLAVLNTIDWGEYPYGFNLSLKVTDSGARPKVGHKLIKLPSPLKIGPDKIFTQKQYEVEVSEIAPPHSMLVSVASWLPGYQSLISFSIIAGNEGEHFYIDSSSGVLFTNSHLDAESHFEYSLTVAATSPGIYRPNQQNSAKIFIRVVDSNDFTPMIVAPQGVVTIEEHQNQGSWVTKVRAQDYDSGDNKRVSYFIANVEKVPFVIDNFSGEIRTSEVLDYETGKHFWKLKIRATDWGAPFNRESEKVIVVRVLDINDNRPQFEQIDCSGYIDKEAPFGTEIFTFSALDFDKGNIISYRILDGNEDRCFTLDPSSGVLTLACDLEDFRSSERALNVTATDGEHFADTMTIRLKLVYQKSSNNWVNVQCKSMGIVQKMKEQIYLSALNNPTEEDGNFELITPSPLPNQHFPEIFTSRIDLRIRENSSPGTVVHEVEAHDSDEGYDGYLIYAIVSGNEESVFNINMKTGVISVMGYLDRERVPRYSLNISISDLGDRPLVVFQIINIILVDENDNIPKMEKPAYSFYLPENIANGASIYQFSAYDPDEGLNGVISYRLDTDTKDFYLDSVSGKLSVSQPLDYETQNLYDLRIVLTDGGALSSYAYITVELIDINDCAPEFRHDDAYIIPVPEDLPLGAMLTLISAHDADSSAIRYSLLNNFDGTFELDSNTAILRLRRPLDYEVKSLYNISVMATDDGSPSLSSNTSVVIQVLDVDENVHAPVFGQDVLVAKVSESSPPHTLVVSATAKDGDHNTNPNDAFVSYSIVASLAEGYFYIDQSGDIYTSAWLDRETTSFYWLTVRATDSGTVPRHSTLHVYIEIEDVNDNFPLSPAPVYWSSVSEDASPNTPVVTIIAEDADVTEAEGRSNIVYSLSSTDSERYFKIDYASGEIRTSSLQMDRELFNEHFLEVIVRDGDGSNSESSVVRSSTTYVIVTVTDENDHAPEFLERVYSFKVPYFDPSLPSSPEIPSTSPMSEIVENLDSSFIGQVVARDLDADENGAISYRIVDEKFLENFKIDMKTGYIHATKDISSNEKHQFKVEAFDHGHPQKRSYCMVNVIPTTVPLQSPNPPSVRGGDIIVTNVMESDPVGYVVHSIDAFDPDGDLLWFAIKDGNTDDNFAIGRETGALFIAKSLDAEGISAFRLSVSITDGVHVTIVVIEIQVIDVNDNRPTFSSSSYEFEIGENASPSSTIFTLSASDDDSDTKLLTYELFNAAHISSLSKFRIHPTKGDIVLEESLDREVQDIHVLTVSVRDRGTPVKQNFARVTVKVRDYNDHSPRFLSSVYNVTVLRSTSVGSRITRVYAVDKDKGLNGHIVYSISSGNLGNYFRIDPDLGEIYLARSLRDEVLSHVILSVKASDSGSPSKYSLVSVNILAILGSDSPPKFRESDYFFELSEGTNVGSYIGMLTADSHLSVVYSMMPDHYAIPFTINPATGVLSLDKPLDFEVTRSYKLTVIAMSLNGRESTANVLISVKDENDNAPKFNSSVYIGHISEAAPVNSVVLMDEKHPLVVSAFDKDSEANSNLFYSILEEEARLYFAIDSSTGAIKTIASLDHEVLPSLNMSVSVHDGGNPRLTSLSNAFVLISITDINDVAPRFLSPEFNATVFIPTYKGVSVLKLKATDLDFGGKSKLIYSIAAGNKGRKFVIDSNSGLISINDSSNLREFYKLKVTVNDGHFASSASVNIYVENLPSNGLRFALDKYFATVEENSTKIKNIAILSVLGSDLNEPLQFKILNPSPLFNIRKSSGIIQTTGIPFDREEKDNYFLVTEAVSSRKTFPRRIAHVVVHVVVSDMNDNAPLFVNTPYYGVVPVDSPAGSLAFKVHATDFDTGRNSQVRYELQKGNGEIFLVDRQSGEIRLKQPVTGVSFEHELIIMAYDGGNPPLSSQVSVRLKIVDRSQPIFDQQFYSASVLENAEIRSPILTINARSQLDRKLIYSLSSGNKNEKFDLEHDLGILSVKGRLDFETQKSYQLKARAIDKHTGKYAEVLISILIKDVNDNPPEFSKSFYNISVSEAAVAASPILQVFTTDPDSVSNGSVSYQIKDLDGTSPRNFYMEGSSGMLILKRSLDKEVEPFHHFLVIATDAGSPPLTSTAQIYVHVSDMNDNAPSFDQPSFKAFISEGALKNQFVCLISAFDPDESDRQNLIFSIVNGNDFQAFAIDASKGIVSVWNHHRLRERVEHKLNISVSDGVFTAYSRLEIAISPVNTHSPFFKESEYEVTVRENSPPGTSLLTLEAQDDDLGRYGEVTYIFVGEEAGAFLQINEKTGEIRTIASFDHEMKSEYSFYVMALDLGGRSGFSKLKIFVEDDNDNPPSFSRSSYNSVLKLNATKGSLVTTVIASDIDSGLNGEVKYKFGSSTSAVVNSSLSIDENNGQIRLKISAKSLNLSLVEFFVEAFDLGEKVLRSRVPVNIQFLQPEFPVPEFLQSNYTFSVREDAPLGTIVGSVVARFNRALRFSIEWGQSDPVPFAVDDDGQISIRGILDFERQNKYLIEVSSYPRNQPEFSGFATVVIEVLDINDVFPRFESDKYYVSVAENTPVGANIIKVSAHDLDSGLGSELRYNLIESLPLQEEPLFILSPYSGWLSLNGQIDAEKNSKFELIAKVVDGGVPPLSSNTTIVIQAIDYNDNPPKFPKRRYRSSVREDVLPGTVVTALSVDDLDESSDTNVNYYITAGNDDQNFHVRKGGQVYVARQLDRERTEKYRLTVTVTDGIFVTTTMIEIEVLDVDDNKPICIQSNYRHYISEDAAVGTMLLTVSAYDPDIVAPPRYFLSGEGSESFSIDKRTGKLAVRQPLDREEKELYDLRITVRDGAHPDWKCHCSVSVEIGDVNDNPPLFSQKRYNLNVPENSPNNLILMKIPATDLDLGVNQKISYSLEGSNKFVIDRETGILSATRSLDREVHAMFNLTVTAHDHGTPRMSSSVNVLILVADVNDNPPEFASKIYFTTIPENSEVGTDIIRVLATSRDYGKNAEITYSIIGGNEHRKVAIHPKSGSLSIIDSLDYERGSTYMLTIQARDGGDPPLSNHATVNVTVTDVNDNQPVFIQNSYSAVVNEAAPSGEKLIKVVATDQDSGRNGRVSYSILSGDQLRQFRVNEHTGEVSVKGPLDRESISSYTLEVLAVDEGVPQKSGSVSIYIEVLDANDNPPMFTHTNNTIYLQEDKPINYLIYSYEVTDQDSENDRNAGPFTFEIREGNSDGSFRITPDGELRTDAKFDHKIRDLYRLLIRVYDNGRQPLSSETWVNIKIIEESQFPPEVFPLKVIGFLQSDSYNGGRLGQVQASDEDLYDTLVYSIIPDRRSSNGKYFSIDKHSGILSASSNIDEGFYRLNVSVSDGKFHSYELATVRLTEINEKMLENSLVVKLRGASASEFLLTYRNNFHKAISNLLKVKLRDTIILGFEDENVRDKREKSQPLFPSYKEGIIKVLFVVKKPNNGYYPRNFVRRKVIGNRKSLESFLGLTIVDVPQNKCKGFKCANGFCKEVISLRDKSVIVSTEFLSFVSPGHEHDAVCICPPGYSGVTCDTIINQCAHSPCPSYQVCIPQRTKLGYICQCKEDFVGATCSLNKSQCSAKEFNPQCYTPFSPLSFKGKGFIQYMLQSPIERHLTFTVWIRTIHPSGTLLYAVGRLDYNILEVVDGQIRFRWDLGSGEGIVVVPNRLVHDGNWHYIMLERIGSSVFLSVDKEWESEGSSPGSNEILNLETRHFYLGAEVHQWPRSSDEPRRGFTGCIDGPRLDNSPLPITHSPSNRVATLVRIAFVTNHCFEPLSPPGPCGSHPCINGGSCREKLNTYTCECPPRFSGSHCEIDLNPCASSPCLNDGHCINEDLGYRCDCPARVTGHRCQFMYCNPNPCLNHGLCEEGISGPICKCHGFTGVYCNVDINECEKNPCEERGMCINTYGAFKCMCHSNFTGSYCDIPSAISAFPIDIEQIVYVVIGVIAIVIVVLFIILLMHFREKHVARRRRRRRNHHQFILNSKTIDNNHHDLYKRNSKMSNLEMSQTCTSRPESFPLCPLNDSTRVNLNNFDTVRSYGSAADELEDLPRVSKDFAQNIAKASTLAGQNRNTSSPVGSSSAGISRLSPTMRHLHIDRYCIRDTSKSSRNPWKGLVCDKNAYYQAGKIQNDVNVSSGELISFKKLKDVVGGDLFQLPNYPRDDVSVRSGMTAEDMQDYHWDCSDWARPSQNPLPNIVEVSVGEVPDGSSFHSNDSNESGVVVKSPLNDSLDHGVLEVLPVSQTMFDSDLKLNSSGRDFDALHFIDGFSDFDGESDISLFNQQVKSFRYKSHPNEYLPQFTTGSEIETDDEKGKLLEFEAESRKFCRKPSNVISSTPPSDFISISRLNDRDQCESPHKKFQVQQSHLDIPSSQSETPINDNDYSISKISSYSPSPPLLSGSSSPPLKLRRGNNRRFSNAVKRLSLPRSPDDHAEGISLFAIPFDTAVSDVENVVCDIEDSEVNSEFENDK